MPFRIPKALKRSTECRLDRAANEHFQLLNLSLRDDVKGSIPLSQCRERESEGQKSADSTMKLHHILYGFISINKISFFVATS